MNTVRFFLLLLSLFFFAFLFRASPTSRIPQRDVLSENISSMQGATFLSYPGSVQLSKTNTYIHYETSDAVDVVTNWYRKNFHLSLRSDTSGSNPEKVVLQGVIGKKPYTVSIQKSTATTQTSIRIIRNGT